MGIKNPYEVVLWQTIQAYKGEVTNPEYNFTDEQKKELLDLTDIAEKYHTSINGTKLGKMYKALKTFDKLFVKYGGNLDMLCDKTDEITACVDSRIQKAGEAIMNTPGALKRLTTLNFRRGKQ